MEGEGEDTIHRGRDEGDDTLIHDDRGRHVCARFRPRSGVLTALGVVEQVASKEWIAVAVSRLRSLLLKVVEST